MVGKKEIERKFDGTKSNMTKNNTKDWLFSRKPNFFGSLHEYYANCYDFWG